jgi:hypothetical protein
VEWGILHVLYHDYIYALLREIEWSGGVLNVLYHGCIDTFFEELGGLGECQDYIYAVGRS